MSDFIHPDLLRTVNHGGNREAEDRFFARIDRETEEVEELRKQGLSTHEALGACPECKEVRRIRKWSRREKQSVGIYTIEVATGRASALL